MSCKSLNYFAKPVKNKLHFRWNNKTKSDKYNKSGESKLIYGSCTEVYIGQAGRSFQKCVSEHKRSFSNRKTSHCEFCKSDIVFVFSHPENFRIPNFAGVVWISKILSVISDSPFQIRQIWSRIPGQRPQKPSYTRSGSKRLNLKNLATKWDLRPPFWIHHIEFLYQTALALKNRSLATIWVKTRFRRLRIIFSTNFLAKFSIFVPLLGKADLFGQLQFWPQLWSTWHELSHLYQSLFYHVF